jgi:calcineurin-like phosphoesterase family protein
MSRDIWFSSDLHLGHANILKFTNYDGTPVRGHLFDSVSEMNECILERHNSVVKPGDIYYNLGDVFFGSKDEFQKLWPKFHGKKRLIPGNHDDIRYLTSGGFFAKVMLWRMFKEAGFVATHVPIHESSMYAGTDNAPLLNLHGHIHGAESPTRMHYNISVERIDYTPVHIDELAKIARERREEWERCQD